MWLLMSLAAAVAAPWNDVGLTTGDTAPSMALQALDGSVVAHQQGRWMAIDFWSTTCGPCIAGFGEWNTMVAAHDGVDFVAVASDPAARVNVLLRKHDLHGTIVADGAEFHDVAGIWSLPAQWVVSADGRLAWRSMDGQTLTPELLERLLAGETITAEGVTLSPVEFGPADPGANRSAAIIGQGIGKIELDAFEMPELLSMVTGFPSARADLRVRLPVGQWRLHAEGSDSDRADRRAIDVLSETLGWRFTTELRRVDALVVEGLPTEGSGRGDRCGISYDRSSVRAEGGCSQHTLLERVEQGTGAVVIDATEGQRFGEWSIEWKRRKGPADALRSLGFEVEEREVEVEFLVVEDAS